MLAFSRLATGRLRDEISRNQRGRNLMRQLYSRVGLIRHVFGLNMAIGMTKALLLAIGYVTRKRVAVRESR